MRPTGLLSVTRMLKTPPRDSLKMFATVTEALRSRGVINPAEHIIMIRSWATATIIVSPQPFSDSQIASARKFAQEHSFDLVHLPGIEPKDINRFHILEEAIYYESARQILSDDYNFHPPVKTGGIEIGKIKGCLTGDQIYLVNSQHCTFRESFYYTSTYEKSFAK